MRRLLGGRHAGLLAIEANDLAVDSDVALGLDPKLAGHDAGIPPALEVQTFFRVDLEPPAMERDRIRRLDLEAGARSWITGPASVNVIRTSSSPSAVRISSSSWP